MNREVLDTSVASSKKLVYDMTGLARLSIIYFKKDKCALFISSNTLCSLKKSYFTL